jgi:ABC-type branched-subunit amino acid transport system permease subunit
VIGVITAISAVRVRGVSLSVVTLAGAVAIENFGFVNTTWGGGLAGSPVPEMRWFGVDLEHDMGLVLGICDRVVVLEFGRVIAEGPPEAVRQDPRVIAAYLGDGVTGGSVTRGSGAVGGSAVGGSAGEGEIMAGTVTDEQAE